jgi:hypothetical protein
LLLPLPCPVSVLRPNLRNQPSQGPESPSPPDERLSTRSAKTNRQEPRPYNCEICYGLAVLTARAAIVPNMRMHRQPPNRSYSVQTLAAWLPSLTDNTTRYHTITHSSWHSKTDTTPTKPLDAVPMTTAPHGTLITRGPCQSRIATDRTSRGTWELRLSAFLMASIQRTPGLVIVDTHDNGPSTPLTSCGSQACLLSRICGVILALGVVPGCDTEQFPWRRRYDSRRIVW